MNSFKMRHVLLIPMMALAVVACAKRDSNFGKKPAPGTQGKPADPAADPAATPGPGDTPATEKTETADGALSYAPKCKNPIKMEFSEKEESLKITDLIKDSNKGTYHLVGTQYYAESEATETEAKEQIAALGSEYKTPENFGKAVKDTQKVLVNCHTTKPVEGKVSKIRASMDFANSFSAADGKGTVIRQDNVAAANGALRTLSTLYSGNTDLKHSLGEGKSEGLKVLIVKHASDQVTIKMQMDRPDIKTGKNIKVWMAATYALVTEEKAADVETKEESTETENK